MFTIQFLTPFLMLEQFLLEKALEKWSSGEIWGKKPEDPFKISKKTEAQPRSFLRFEMGPRVFLKKLHELPFTRISPKTTRHKIAQVAIHEDKPKNHEAQPSSFWAYPSEWPRVQFYAKWFLGLSE